MIDSLYYKGLVRFRRILEPGSDTNELYAIANRGD